jgi:hypothetical protein
MVISEVSSDKNSLQPVIQKKRVVGYVWQRCLGQTPLVSPDRSKSRIIIVVDDDFDLPQWSHDGSLPSSHAYGLPTIFDYAKRSENVQAIGFFDLPNSSELETIQLIVQAIQTWVNDNALSDCDCYLLADYYFGHGFEQNRAFGFNFVNYWMENSPFAAKVAHLTIGGGGNLANPHQLKIFSKSSIQQEMTLDLLAWLGDGQHRLDALWKSHDIASWFTDNRPVMKHDAANVCEYFFGESQDKGKVNRYRQNVEGALEFALPESWWQDQETVISLHNALKCLCGAYFCGQMEQGNGRRNVSVGAAFLIALIAHHEIYGHIHPFADPHMWHECSQTDSPVFSLQRREIAQLSAKALYDFFRCIFMPRDQSIAQFKEQGASQLNHVFFVNSGKKLKIQLGWRADQDLAGMVQEIFTGNNVLLPRSASNTRDAIARLWSYMAMSEEGFMSPGTVYMQRDEVIIASTK